MSPYTARRPDYPDDKRFCGDVLPARIFGKELVPKKFFLSANPYDIAVEREGYLLDTLRCFAVNSSPP